MKTWVVVALLFLLVGSGGAAYLFWPFGTIDRPMKLPGTVEIQEVRLSSKVGGRVEKVLVEEGQVVKSGQALVVLEVPELEAQRDQIKAKLEASQAMYEKVYNGPRAEEKEAALRAMEAAKARFDRMEAGYRMEELVSIREEINSLEADLEKAKRDVDREKKLSPTQASSPAAYDAALANVNRLTSMIKSMKSKSEMMASGYRKEDKAEMKAEFERLRAMHQLMQAGTRAEEKLEALAQVNEMRAKLREMEVMLKESHILAPENAVVEVLGVRKGDIVTPNQPVIKILRADDLWVKAYISEIELGKIHLNQEVAVSCDAFPEKKFKGVITYISSIAEFTPRNVQTLDERRHQVFGFKVRVEDPQGVFKGGMAADIYLSK